VVILDDACRHKLGKAQAGMATPTATDGKGAAVVQQTGGKTDEATEDENTHAHVESPFSVHATLAEHFGDACLSTPVVDSLPGPWKWR
jgi:hypothetical protein